MNLIQWVQVHKLTCMSKRIIEQIRDNIQTETLQI